jgi:hypothetical protein
MLFYDLQNTASTVLPMLRRFITKQNSLLKEANVVRTQIFRPSATLLHVINRIRAVRGPSLAQRFTSFRKNHPTG